MIHTSTQAYFHSIPPGWVLLTSVHVCTGLSRHPTAVRADIRFPVQPATAAQALAVFDLMGLTEDWETLQHQSEKCSDVQSESGSFWSPFSHSFLITNHV